MRYGVFPSLVALAWFSVSHGVEVDDALRACMAESDDGRRLQCYDREMGRLAEKAVDEFGRRDVQRTESKPNDEQLAPKAEPERLVATVTRLSRRQRGELVIVLDNGQIWEQTEARYIPIKAGDIVTIRVGSFGSFWLEAPVSRRTSPVRRVK